jgi:hypothetical protein
MFRHVSQSGQTLGNISEKHRETSNDSEIARKHFFFSGRKFCFRNNVSTGGQTGKHLWKHRESQMFPQQCFLVCPGLYKHDYNSEINSKTAIRGSRKYNFCLLQTYELTVISTSGVTFGISAAIKCRSSSREKSPVYNI